MAGNAHGNVTPVTKNVVSRRYCSVYGCKTKRFNEDISLHYFPKEETLRKTWARVLRIGKPISKYMCVCSFHFTPSDYFLPGYRTKRRGLKPNAVPSRNLPKSSVDKLPRDVDLLHKIAKNARQKRAEKRGPITGPALPIQEDIITPSIPPNELNSGETDVVDPEHTASDLEGANALLELQTAGIKTTDFPTLTERCAMPMISKGVQVNTEDTQHQFCLPQLFRGVHDLKVFTGVHSFELLDTIVECVTTLAGETYKSHPLVTMKNRVTLTLCKLKLNLSYECLAVLFDITPDTCSNYFRVTVQLLAEVMSCLVVWPKKENILSNLPRCFTKFQKTRIVLDCMEVFIERCSCLKCRILTYSHYKGTNTIKVMVGVAPSGLITFESCFFGGRSSDKAICNESGLLDKCDPYDAVMVDKGFLIEPECVERSLNIIRPPFLKDKKQLSRADSLRTADIASARVHVERSIQRLRTFAVLSDRLPWSLLPYADDIIKVVTGLVNLGSPILAVDKF